MTSKLSLVVGDLVVRYGKVLKVFKIKKDTIEFQPFFAFQAVNGLSFTLKLKNAYDGHIRQLVSKSKIKKLLSLIIKKPSAKINPPVYNTKTALNKNQLEETLWIIKILWLEKQKKANTLLGGKLVVFRKAMLQATNEIAAVNKTSPNQAELLIQSGLESSLK
ncbi:MAG: hypothetical protein ABIJ43_00290 [Candidatus Beckwithbacteria bacterium]|nr:hypothetical protein [Patescibacteria group bacterium]